MATTTKKGTENKKAKLRRPVVKKSPSQQGQTIAELRQQLAECLKQKDATAMVTMPQPSVSQRVATT